MLLIVFIIVLYISYFLNIVALEEAAANWGILLHITDAEELYDFY